MLFRSYRPPPPLSRFVDVFWHFSGDGLPHRREHVLPDGSAELVINLDDVPRKRFNRHDLRRFETVRRAWISGPQPEYTVIHVLPRATMMGVHFKPGGLAPFLRMPVEELRGELVELDSLWGSASGDIRDELLGTPDVGSRFQCLERFLAGRACRPLQPDPLVAAALRMFLDLPAVPAISQVVESLGISHKHFIKRFHAAIGLSPKRLCRIRRFNLALADLRARREVDWADVAAAGGYYDQSHFINDFRAFSGMTPCHYLARPGADDRFVPVDDSR